MTWLPVGVTYTSFAEICMIATSIVGVIKFQSSSEYCDHDRVILYNSECRDG